MARATWTGALTFAGFPLPISIYTLSNTKAESFKTLCKCCDQPIAQRNHCRMTDDVVTDTQKGVEVSKGAFSVLSPTAVEAITSSSKSISLEVERFCPLASVPLHLSAASYRVVEDAKAAGAAKPVAILWAALRSTQRALVCPWVPRAGTPDRILVIHAEDDGLIANVLPYLVELSDAPAGSAHTTAVSDQERQMFEQAMGTLYTVADFDHSAYSSEYKVRRQAAIDAALAGTPMPASATPVAPAVPDLMAALSASLAAVKSGGPTPAPKEAVAA